MLSLYIYTQPRRSVSNTRPYWVYHIIRNYLYNHYHWPLNNNLHQIKRMISKGHLCVISSWQKESINNHCIKMLVFYFFFSFYIKNQEIFNIIIKIYGFNFIFHHDFLLSYYPLNFGWNNNIFIGHIIINILCYVLICFSFYFSFSFDFADVFLPQMIFFLIVICESVRSAKKAQKIKKSQRVEKEREEGLLWGNEEMRVR